MKSSHKDTRLASFFDQINEIKDPRCYARDHPFKSMMTIALCAMIGGANNDRAIVEFGKLRVNEFKKIIPLPCGIPSRSTFLRLLNGINQKEMQLLLNLVPNELKNIGDNSMNADEVEIQSHLERQRIMDGKSLRALHAKESHMLLNAYNPSAHKLIGQMRIDRKTNEITAIPKLLAQIKSELPGTIFTSDAIGTQKNIVADIRSYGADYLLPVKGNQHHMYCDLKLFLDDIPDGNELEILHTFHETHDTKHGRIETRKCWTTHVTDWFDEKHLWKDLKTISVIETTIIKNGKTSVSRRYYISSLLVKASIILALARNHWSIENNLHWSLNTSFKEHIATTRGSGAENKSTLRCVSLALLRRSPGNLSIDNKRARAAKDFDFLMEVLLGDKIDLRSPGQKAFDAVRNGLNYAVTNAYYYIGSAFG